MKNYYQYRNGLPYHLSVAAVIANEKSQVLCHYYKSIVVEGQEYQDFYILMRETVEPGESLEQALKRGAQEEMGAEIEVEDYLGPIVSHFKEAGFGVEKTTLYFKCRLIALDNNRRKLDDPEKGSLVSWQPIDELISRMREQRQRLERQDLDESAVLERLRP